MIRKEYDICPKCGGQTQPRGGVKRIVRDEKGIKRKIFVTRFSCKQCGAWHRVLPDGYLSYKQYSKAIINRYLSEECYESYPCDLTIIRWKKSQK